MLLESDMENGGKFCSSRRKYRSSPVESSRVGEAGGIDIANGKGKLGLLNRMWPIPFPPNQLLRFIVVGSVLSMTFIGVLFVYSLLRILVKPCSRRFYRFWMDTIQGQAIEILVLLLPRATIHVTGISHLPDGLHPAAMIANRVISTGRGREAWALVLIARALGTKERIRFVECHELHECIIETVACRIISHFHLWVPHTNVSKVILEKTRNVNAPERNNEYPAGNTMNGVNPPLFIHFPEGGFERSVCSDVSLKRSEMRPVMKHLLVPRVQTFSACVKALGNNRPTVIHDVTLVEPNAPSLHKPFSSFGALCVALSCPLDLHAHVNCYPLADILDNEYWLENRWKEKDRLIAYFRRYNRFPDANSIIGASFVPSLPATIGAPPCKSMVLDTGTWQLCGSILPTVIFVFSSLAVAVLFLLSLPVALPVYVLWYIAVFILSSGGGT